MPQNMILLPVLVQVALTFAVLMVMGAARGRSMAARRQKLQDVALAGDRDWEPSALQAANNYKNQFEMPVLFYAVTAFALLTRQVDQILFGLAWVFVASRVIHTFIHLGGNMVAARGGSFLIGAAAVFSMWVVLGWRIAAAGF